MSARAIASNQRLNHLGPRQAGTHLVAAAFSIARGIPPFKALESIINNRRLACHLRLTWCSAPLSSCRLQEVR